MKTKIEELIKAGELATGGEWLSVSAIGKVSKDCSEPYIEVWHENKVGTRYSPRAKNEDHSFLTLSANARPAIKQMYEENVRLREALEHAVLIAEGTQAGNWDDLLEYRKTLRGGGDE